MASIHSSFSASTVSLPLQNDRPESPSASDIQPAASGQQYAESSAATGQIIRRPNTSSYPKDDLFKALNNAQKPGKASRAVAGAVGAVAVPFNAITGCAIGAVRGGFKYGPKEGHDLLNVPVIRKLLAIAGAPIGAVVGAIVQPINDVHGGLVKTRRLLGRYNFVNAGLSVKSDSMQDLAHILSSIPENRISKDPDNGHTIVTIKTSDMPYVEENALNILSAAFDYYRGSNNSRFDDDGNCRVDVDAVIEGFGANKGLLDHKFAIKAKDLRAPASPSPELCRSEEKEKGRTSIYIQSNIQDPETASKAGLQFIYELDKNLNN